VFTDKVDSSRSSGDEFRLNAVHLLESCGEFLIAGHMDVLENFRSTVVDLGNVSGNGDCVLGFGGCLGFHRENKGFGM